MSRESIKLEGREYLSAPDAATFAGLSRDYIARLCREHALVCEQIGKNWYVERASLQEFLVLRQYRRGARREALSNVRAAEYHGKVAPEGARDRRARVTRGMLAAAPFVAPQKGSLREKLSQALTMKASDVLHGGLDLTHVPDGFMTAAVQAAHVPVHSVSPIVEAAHKFAAVFFTVVLLFSAYAAFQPVAARYSLTEASDNAGAVAAAYTSLAASAGRAVASVESRLEYAANEPQAVPGQLRRSFTAASGAVTDTGLKALDTGAEAILQLIDAPTVRNTQSADQVASVFVTIEVYTPQDSAPKTKSSQ